jgi:hypothetical protein
MVAPIDDWHSQTAGARNRAEEQAGGSEGRERAWRGQGAMYPRSHINAAMGIP